MRKYIANFITSSRIIFSLALLFLPTLSAWFFACYFCAGLTDMIDGTIARKLGTASKFGAKLDTISDLVFMVICGIKILPIINLPLWLWVWIIIIALVKISTATLVFIRKKRLISIHSVLNKIVGLTLFLLPLTLTFIDTLYSVATICAFATISAVQEVYFVAKGKEIV